MIPGPKMHISGNAISLTGGHEDAIGFNPDQHVLSNTTYPDNADELVKTIREQVKLGADFIKIYETGMDSYQDKVFKSMYQSTDAELAAAVAEAARLDTVVSVHCTADPGASYAVAAGVVSIDHAYHLRDATMRAMKEKQIYAGPTFAIAEYFADHSQNPAAAEHGRAEQAFHAEEFRKQLAAGDPDGGGERRRSVSPRNAGEGVGTDGAIRYEARSRVAGGSAQRREAADVGWQDRGTEGRLLCRCHCRAGEPDRGYLCGDESKVRHEGWHNLQARSMISGFFLPVSLVKIVTRRTSSGIPVTRSFVQ
jgi:Amidohydrolase family